ncbi:MAG: hypothetical protein AAF483_20610 [Planctomycetota bacterium]
MRSFSTNFQKLPPAFAVIALLLANLVGCGGSAGREEAVKFFGITYFNYMQIYKKAPAGWDDVLKLADAPGLEEDLEKLQSVQNASYTIRWDAANDGQDAVLAYLPEATKNGGKVLVVSGALIQMTAEELNAKL